MDIKHENRVSRHRSRISAAALALAGSTLFMTDDVSAQTTSSQAAENKSDPDNVIVVTARRREENLQDVPVAVSAFGQEALQNLQAANLGDLEGAVPNLSLHVGDAANAVVYIRGVGQVDSLAFADPGVGIYVDDVYLGRAQGAFLDVYDVARIEVLRGPQGTLYGRNTIGGAVKFVSSPLTNDFSGSLEATYGSYDRFDMKGMVNIPVVDEKLIAKAAIAHSQRRGYATNLASGDDDGDKDLWAGRIALEFRPSSDFTLRVTGDISHDQPDSSRTPARATSVFGTFPPNDDPFEVNADFNDRNELKTSGLSAVASWTPNDAVELKSISAYRTMDYDSKLDLDGTEAAFFGVYVNEAQNQFSQELQFNYNDDRLSAVAGLFYFREHDDTLSGLYGPAIALVTASVNDQINKSYAAYGQFTYQLSDHLSATAGMRYTYEDKKFLRTQSFFDAATPFPFDPDQGGLLVTDIDTAANWDSFSPKFGIEYKPTEDVLVYANASRGFKSGGFDGRANTSEDATPYEPETMWSYEGGIKSSLFDRKLTANLSVFQNEYKNLQLSSFVADTQGNFSALFTNAGKATIRGFEMELALRPVRGLNLSALLSHLDSQYDRFIGPGGNDISDQRKLVNAPRWSWRLAADYIFDLGNLGTLTTGVDAAHRSKSYTVVSSSEELAQKPNTLIDAFIRFATHDDGLWISAGVKNLTDKRYITHGFDLSDSLGYQLAYYGDPRTYNLSVGYRF
ncbi:TonB-dependent receptor [Parasphingorhabdus sp.]|uniref:TonB-dependent receptor n=1 Tax=Parasphingorhabdus sp. TaxID=2709688 RepID=UPI003A8F6B8A